MQCIYRWIDSTKEEKQRKETSCALCAVLSAATDARPNRIGVPPSTIRPHLAVVAINVGRHCPYKSFSSVVSPFFSLVATVEKQTASASFAVPTQGRLIESTPTPSLIEFLIIRSRTKKKLSHSWSFELITNDVNVSRPNEAKMQLLCKFPVQVVRSVTETFGVGLIPVQDTGVAFWFPNFLDGNHSAPEDSIWCFDQAKRSRFHRAKSKRFECKWTKTVNEQKLRSWINRPNEVH